MHSSQWIVFVDLVLMDFRGRLDLGLYQYISNHLQISLARAIKRIMAKIGSYIT